MQVRNESGSTARTLLYTGLGAGAGAAVKGGMEYALQKAKLGNADEYITNLEGQAAVQIRKNNAFRRGTEKAAQLAKNNIDTFVKNEKDFVSKGKYDFGAISKAAGKGALLGGAAAAGIYALYKFHKNEVRDNARIAAQEFNKQCAPEND